MSDAVNETAKWAREALAKKEREKAAQQSALQPIGRQWFKFDFTAEDVEYILDCTIVRELPQGVYRSYHTLKPPE